MAPEVGIVTRANTMVLCLSLLVGCGGRNLGQTNTNDNRNGDRRDGSLPGRDGAVPADAWVLPDSGVCEDGDWWELRATPLTSITVLNPQLGGDGIPSGVTVRVETVVNVTGCDELAGVQAEVHPADRTVILAGYVWKYHGPEVCPHESRDQPEYLAFEELVAGQWSLMDILPNDPGVPFWIRPCGPNEDCECNSWQGVPGDWGTTCDYDCMCQGGLGCGYDEATPTCYQTCSVTADCPIPLFCNFFLPQSAQGVCMSTGMLDSCQSDTDCAAGFDCLPVEGTGYDWCQPAMATQPVGRPCGFDCDCPAGYVCAQTDDTMQRFCQIRCRGNQDCPAGMVCDPEAAGTDFIANSLVCQFSQDSGGN